MKLFEFYSLIYTSAVLSVAPVELTYVYWPAAVPAELYAQNTAPFVVMKKAFLRLLVPLAFIPVPQPILKNI